MTHPCHKGLKMSSRTHNKTRQTLDNGKRVNSRQAMNSHESRARIRLRHYPLVPSQYRRSGPWVRGKRGYGLAVGRRKKSILGFPLKFFWGKCLAGMTYHPKEGKMSWNHWVHASKREYSTLIRIGMPRRARK